MAHFDEPSSAQLGGDASGDPANQPARVTPEAADRLDEIPQRPTLDPDDMQRGMEAAKKAGLLEPREAADLPPGVPAVVGNRYELVEPLGNEELAVVFRARDRLNGRTVAVKLLDTVLLTDAGLLDEGFRRAAARIAALRYQGIVEVYDYGATANGTYYLVMEHVVGETLQELLRNDELRVESGVELMIQVAAALDYIHREGLAHRDLKPGNILVAYEEKGHRAKLLDFGLARRVRDRSELTQRGKLLGSLRCMSPEQARGEDADHRADIWAVGVMLHRITSRSYPFDGRAAQEIMHAIEHAPTPLLGRAGREIPGLEVVVRRCLEKKPENRYQSAYALAMALKACVRAHREGNQPSAWVLSPPRIPLWWTSRNAIALATAAVLLGMGLACAVLATSSTLRGASGAPPDAAATVSPR